MRFAADENLNNNILRALRREVPDLDIVRVQDVGLANVDDPTILAWCATERRVMVTHDRRTMVGHAVERLAAGQPMPGMVIVDDRAKLGAVIEDLVLIAECETAADMEGQVRFVPFS